MEIFVIFLCVFLAVHFWFKGNADVARHRARQIKFNQQRRADPFTYRPDWDW